MLLALNSFDYDTDISNHPQMMVIFNNVSLQEQNETYLERIKERIREYKFALKANAKLFYVNEVSDDTVFGDETWVNLKEEVCIIDKYKNQTWYTNLSGDKKELLEMLKEIQQKEGLDKPLQLQDNPQMNKLIETRVDLLFPEENFYFFKLLKNANSEIQMVEERNQLRKLINDNIRADRYYIKKGLLEPVHL